MQINLVRPNLDFPFGYVHVDIMIDVDREDLKKTLADYRLTLLGRWEPHFEKGKVKSLKAPVLLENEHVKPPKTRTRAKKK